MKIKTVLFAQNSVFTYLASLLKSEGVNVLIELKEESIRSRIGDDKPDLVIIDGAVNGSNAIEVCSSLRSEFDGGILVLANGDGLDEVEALEAGADSFLVHPIRDDLFLARVKSMLRGCVRGPAAPDPLVIAPGVISNMSRRIDMGRFVIDAASRTVQIGERRIGLTSAEFDLLWLLAQYPGETVTRDQIYRELRGIAYNGLDRSVDLRVARLRKKLGDDGRMPHTIKSVRSVGYMLVVDRSDRDFTD